MNRTWLAAVAGLLGCHPGSLAQSGGERAAEMGSGAAPALQGFPYDEPFFPGADYDARIPTPDAVLGRRLGDTPASHADVMRVVDAIASAGSRVKVFEYARSHEGRDLRYAVITSPENLARLEQIQRDLGRLADPRTVSAAEADALVARTPIVAWMGYVIHGDEGSGTDAALALYHHLASARDEATLAMLREMVIIIDPLMNPDGRDRWVSMIQQQRTKQPNVDHASLIHTGLWPSGRTNHYLFDLNRDWIFCTQPETRGRIAAVNSWNPQFFLESHEMGAMDTFLFFPPREPINRHEAPTSRQWWETVAADHAKAFDRHGWRYYTGEWNEGWYPGYSSSWASLGGAIAQLYEQARTATDGVRRPEGTIETFREAVHKQLVSSVANLQTIYTHRREILRDFVAGRREVLAEHGTYADQVFAILPSANVARLDALLEICRVQGFEAYVASREFVGSGRDVTGEEFTGRSLPAGTILLPARQPRGRLLASMFEFDPRVDDAFLTAERRELLRFNRSLLYDVTAWNIPMMFGLDAIELEMRDLPSSARALEGAQRGAMAAGVVSDESTIAWVFDGADDRSVSAAAQLMERGVEVRAADLSFRFGDVSFARGSIVVVRNDNRDFPANLLDTICEVARRVGIGAQGIATGLDPGDGPDLGGEHFILLEPARIALVGNAPVSGYGYGEMWHLIDRVLGIRATYLDGTDLDSADLRRYNVIVVPGGGRSLIREHADALRAWAESGGTLIAMGSATGAVTDPSAALGTVRERSGVLEELDAFNLAVIREWEGRHATGPSSAWSHEVTGSVTYPWAQYGANGGTPSLEELKRRDEWERIFTPQGAFVACRTDDRHWLTCGASEMLPIMVDSDRALLTRGDAAAPVRLGQFVKSASELHEASAWTSHEGGPVIPPAYALRMRLSGLLWPESAKRLANSACVTQERVGRGQIILFAHSPTLRAAALASQRLVSNAMVLGPGMGATSSVPHAHEDESR